MSDVLLDLGAGVPREPIRLPIYIGATGMQMMELAGEVADGVLLNGFRSSEYTRKAIERIHMGATRVGRDHATIDTPQLVDVSVSPDRGAAYEQAKWVVAMYLGASRTSPRPPASTPTSLIGSGTLSPGGRPSGTRTRFRWIQAHFDGSKRHPRAKFEMWLFPLNHAPFRLAERRRSRTYQPWGYHGLPVLKFERIWV